MSRARGVSPLTALALILCAVSCGSPPSSEGPSSQPASSARTASSARLTSPCPVSTPLVATAASTPGVPAGRLGAGLTYDPKHGYLLMFGGADPNPPTPLPVGFVKPVGYNNAVSDETWTWNGNRWNLLHPPTSPSARSFPAMAYDPHLQQVILLGGGAPNSDPGRHDMWAWDGTTWIQLHPGSLPTIERPGLVLDRDLSAVIGLGPDAAGHGFGVWQWTGSDWTYTATVGGPSVRFGFSFAYDLDQHADVLAAGYFSMGPDGGARETWLLRQGTWSLAPAGSVGPATYATAAFDEARHQLVLLAAGECAPSDWADETWTWTGDTWTRHYPVHRPPGELSSESMAYDVVSGRVLVFGGKSDELQSNVTNQTWVWDGTDWVRLT